LSTREIHRHPSNSELEAYIEQSNNGDLDSSTYLLWLYTAGPDSYRNHDAAKAIVQKLKPHRHARLSLDTAYYYFVTGDMDKYEEHLTLAASLDNPLAQIRLARRKLQLGRPVNAEVVPLLRRATELGNLAAQLGLGRLLMRERNFLRFIEGLVIFTQGIFLVAFYFVAKRNSSRVQF
jgi:TPR repeat protein